jgi:hypothetical protein
VEATDEAIRFLKDERGAVRAMANGLRTLPVIPSGAP